MRCLVISIILAIASSARAAPSTAGPYIAWELTGWFPTDRLKPRFAHADNGTQFGLIAGLRRRHLAIEAWTSPAMNSGISVHGIDAKLLLPIGRYLSTYGRLRLAHMTVDLDPYSTNDRNLVGYGGGEAIGIQTQFSGRTFGLLVPPWFAAPFGWRGTGGIFVEVGHEEYALGVGDGPAKGERFWRFAYGVSWGAAF